MGRQSGYVVKFSNPNDLRARFGLLPRILSGGIPRGAKLGIVWTQPVEPEDRPASKIDAIRVGHKRKAASITKPSAPRGRALGKPSSSTEPSSRISYIAPEENQAKESSGGLRTLAKCKETKRKTDPSRGRCTLEKCKETKRKTDPSGGRCTLEKCKETKRKSNSSGS